MPDWPHGDGEMARRIRAHDWLATPLGAIGTWPASLRVALSLILDSPLPAILAWGPELTTFYNDAYRPLLGDKAEALGRPIRDVWGEAIEIIGPQIDRALAGESTYFENAAFTILRGERPETAFFDYSYSPVRDETGRVAGILNTAVEKTRQVLADQRRSIADAALAEGEARLRALVTAGNVSIYRMSADWRFMRELDSVTLAVTAEPLEGWSDKYILAEDRPRVLSAIEAAIQTKSLFELEHRVRLADGSVGWVLSRAVPIFGADGEIVEWFGGGTDITDRVRASEALRESEALRGVALAGGGMGTWRWDLANRLVSGDAQFLALWGFPPSEEPIPLSAFTDRMSAKGAAEMEAIVTKAIEADEEFDGPLEIMSGPTTGHWIQWRGRPSADDRSVLHGVTFDITERKRAEAVLTDREARQAFLLKLSDTLRAEVGVDAVANRALQAIAEQLRLDRAYLVTLNQDDDLVTVTHETRRQDMPPLQGTYHSSDFPTAIREIFDRTIFYDDVRTDPRLTPLDRESFAGLGAVGFAAASLRRGGETMIWAAGAVSTHPRNWTPADISLLEDAIERTWSAIERARAEAALRENEQRLAALFESVPVGITFMDAEGRMLISNAEAQRFLPSGGMPSLDPARGWRWHALDSDGERLPETEFPGARALRGLTTVPGIEMIYTDDTGAERWTSVSAVPLHDDTGEVTNVIVAMLDVDTVKRAEEALRENEERLRVLVAELQHRVRNILAVVRSVFGRTVEAGGSTGDVADHFRGRLDSLARTQVIVTQSASGLVGLENLIRDELLSVGAIDGPLIAIDGPEVLLPSAAAESLGLAIHELTTNALKYGALKVSGAKLAITWKTNAGCGSARRLILNWVEDGVPAVSLTPARKGFGTELIEDALPYRLDAETSLEFRGGGVRCTISLPLPQRETGGDWQR